MQEASKTAPTKDMRRTEGEPIHTEQKRKKTQEGKAERVKKEKRESKTKPLVCATKRNRFCPPSFFHIQFPNSLNVEEKHAKKMKMRERRGRGEEEIDDDCGGEKLIIPHLSCDFTPSR